MLSVKNAPSQVVKELNPILKKTVSIKTTNATNNIYSNIRVQFSKK